MNARDILHYGHDFVMRHLNGLPMQHWETDGVCGWWGVKEIIAHLASYEILLVEVLNSFHSDRPTPYLNQLVELGGGGFNDFQVSIRQNKTPAEVLAEYEEAHAATLEAIGQFKPEELQRTGTLPWYGREYSLDDFIVYQYYGHKREHTAQINVFKDTFRTNPERRPASYIRAPRS